MNAKIIGREKEQDVLKSCFESEKAELIAVYGRRRVGKTFLVKNFFREKFDFYITGIYQGSKKEQLQFFNRQLCAHSGVPYPYADNWFDALLHFGIEEGPCRHLHRRTALAGHTTLTLHQGFGTVLE